MNTDRELWRKTDDYCSPALHVTKGDGIGMNVGGHVIVMPIEKWHSMALKEKAEPAAQQESELADEIVRRVADSAIRLAIIRGYVELTGENEEDEIVSRTIDCLTGDDTGCNDPEDLDETNCELIWVENRLRARQAEPAPTPSRPKFIDSFREYLKSELHKTVSPQSMNTIEYYLRSYELAEASSLGTKVE